MNDKEIIQGNLGFLLGIDDPILGFAIFLENPKLRPSSGRRGNLYIHPYFV
jgi:hypothetical protein